MAHHGSNPESAPELERFFRRGQDAQRAMDDLTAKLGATGNFPHGKLTESDEGEIRIAIGQKDGKVVIDFGTPTSWIGFTPDQADEIATLLKTHAANART